jgi:hypothetical protein
MGEVYRARDTRLAREVAIKVLPAELASDASRLKRFEKEARSASALNHPNIVTIYDIGTADSLAYIAMERVEGRRFGSCSPGGPCRSSGCSRLGHRSPKGSLGRTRWGSCTGT